MERENELKIKRICRFCLCQESEKLDSIFEHGKLGSKATAPLPTQVLAIASIEVFVNDGMPQWVCHECRLLFEHSYRFKQMCKRAETLLKQYPLTGTWPQALVKPRIPLALIPKQTLTTNATTSITTTPPMVVTPTPIQTEAQTKQENNVTSPNALSSATVNHTIPTQKLAIKSTYARKKGPKDTNATPTVLTTNTATSPIKKILNANPVASPEPPIPVRIKREKLHDGKTATDDAFLLADDIKDITDVLENGNVIKTMFASPTSPVDAIKKPRVLNKSSIRILNKEAEVSKEPRLRELQLKRDKDGNVAIVTEIMDPDEPYETEPDPVKTAVPVETNVFPCPHCERSFPLHQLRDIHMVKHNRERSFPCPECDRSFFSKYDLQKHSLVHTGDRPFKCKVCERGFTRATLLYRHEKSHTDMPKYLCVYCEKTFLSKDEMQKHAQRHLKTRPFPCKICFKSFAFKQGLERHEVIHSRVQPHPCQYCNLSFSTPSKLARHLTAHAGKRPYPCKFCSKSYLLSHHLTRHLRSHTQGANIMFHCFLCKMEFKTREAFITHSVMHGTETLSCPLCKETFSDVQTVGKHIRAHVKGEIHACEFCDMIFMLPDRLQKHIDADHVEDMKAYREDDKAQSQRMRDSVDELQKTLDEVLVEDVPPNHVNILKDEIIKPVQLPKIIASKKIAVGRMSTMNYRNANDLKLLDVKLENSDEKNTQELASTPPVKSRKVETATKPIITKKENITTLRRKVPKAVVEPVQSKKTDKTIANQPTIQTSSGAVVEPVQAKKTDKTIANQPTIRTSSQAVKKIGTAQKSLVGNAIKLSDEQTTRGLRVSDTQSKNGNAHKNDSQNATEKVMVTNEKISTNLVDKGKVVKKFLMKRSEADLMTKDGRIRIIDGTMYLTNSNNK